MPGGETLLLLDAMRRQGIEFILMHHEMSAGFAADASGQLTGIPGVCLSTLGPGAVNLAAAAASATLERSPMLAITAEFDPRIQGRVTHMQVDLQQLFGAVAKASYAVRPENALACLSEAWVLAGSHPYGAVHVSISPETAAAATERSHRRPSKPGMAGPSEAQLAKAIRRLEAAGRVCILAGLGVEASAGQASLLRLAEAGDIPVMVTPKAKGNFPEAHPLYAGCFSAYGDGPIREALREADLILGVGLDGVDFVTAVWDIPTQLVNVEPTGLVDPVTRPKLVLAGPLGDTLDRLRAAHFLSQAGRDRAAQIRQGVRAALATGFLPRDGQMRLEPLIAGMRAALPAEGVVTLDVGVFKLVFLQQWRTSLPKTLFVANGLSAMGYAIPAALAVKLERPERPVVAIVGDGALHMYAGELATIARSGVPMVLLVIVDEALALIRLKQQRMNLAFEGTEFGTTDYRALAGAFGLGYQALRREETIQTDLEAALQEPGPVLVEAPIVLDEYEHFR
jgi:acetolactate synthase-1/2/3 large subunit